jgi:hypothetical protein
MIDNLVDVAVASLLKASTSGVQGLTVVEGIEDNVPDLVTPYLVVYSAVQKEDAKTPVYTLKTTIELVTLSGVADETFVSNTMSVIDAALNNTPSPAVMAQVQTAGLSHLSWHSIDKSTQEIGDRRKDVRELITFASLS